MRAGWLMVALGACGDDEPEACDPAAVDACADGLVCESVDTEDGPLHTCVAPVRVEGIVFSLGDGSPIEGARVVALDATGSPVSRVGASGTDGAYAVAIPTDRDEEGRPKGGRTVTLRADAAGFEGYPGGVRPALPVDTAGAVAAEDGGWVVRTAATDLALLPAVDGGTGRIVGSLEVPPDGVGVLVVAEGPTAPRTAIADLDGSFVLFNVAAGTWDVTGYARGSTYVHAPVEVADGGEATVTLARQGDAGGGVAGNVQIVNAPGGARTSIVLVVESTFDDVLERGPVPPGLRAPSPGTAPNVSGDFSIGGVPPGRYVVLAAFENDGLVRDPDTSIGGTQIQHVEVVGAATVQAEGFKITEALEIFGPGAEDPEAVTAAPTLSWADDSSEDAYDVRVFDAYGNLVWEDQLAGFSGDDPSVTYGGPMEPGMVYQFRVRSAKDGTYLSQTEDLRGVFYVE